jgi:hypothetical protein
MLIQVAHLLHTHHPLEVIATVLAEDLTMEAVAAAAAAAEVVEEEAAGDTKVSCFDATSEFQMLQLIDPFFFFTLSQLIPSQHLIAMYIKLQLLHHMYHQNDHPIIILWCLLPSHPYLTLM